MKRKILNIVGFDKFIFRNLMKFSFTEWHTGEEPYRKHLTASHG